MCHPYRTVVLAVSLLVPRDNTCLEDMHEPYRTNVFNGEGGESLPGLNRLSLITFITKSRILYKYKEKSNSYQSNMYKYIQHGCRKLFFNNYFNILLAYYILVSSSSIRGIGFAVKSFSD